MFRKSLWGISKKTLLKQVANLEKKNAYLRRDNIRLNELCELKDKYFKELMSDGLRNGSPLAAKHMVERRMYMNGK